MPDAALLHAPAAAVAPRTPPHPGIWHGYVTLLRWKLAQVGSTVLPMVIVVQGLLAAGIVVGFGLLMGDVAPASALFLSTGAPTALLMIVGLVMVPSGVAASRADGTLAYQRALPVHRPLLLVVELTVWLLVALASVVVAVVVARLRYDVAFAFDWPLLVSAVLLSTLTATSVGYAIAVSFPPLIAQLASQVLVFFVLLFSPVTFPASRLPTWFQMAHDVLPVRPAADLVRAGLASGTYDRRSTDMVVLVCWCLFGLLLSVRALVRRP